MQIPGLRRSTVLAGLALGAMLSLSPVHGYAVSKETIQMQTQIQQLLDMVQRLQTTLDATKFAVLQNLGSSRPRTRPRRMNGTVTALQQKMNTQMENLNGKLDTNSGQVQSLNDSVDELKTRIAALQKTLQEMQNQLQNVQQPRRRCPVCRPRAQPLHPTGPAP